MSAKAAKGRKLLSLAAALLLAAVGAALPAEASRWLPSSLEPHLDAVPAALPAAPQAPVSSLSFVALTVEDQALLLAASDLDPNQRQAPLCHRRHRLFKTPLAAPLDRARGPKTASRRFSNHPTHNPLSTHVLRWNLRLGEHFLEPDPLGPIDSPNLYQAFGFDAFNVTDPWGMQVAPPVTPAPNEVLRLFYSDWAEGRFGDEPGLPTLLAVVGGGDPEGVFVNGILNPQEAALQNALASSELLGASLQPVWNPTDGNALFDIAQTALVNKLDVEDATTELVIDTVRAVLAENEGPVLLVGHSQGGAIVSSAASHLSPEERAQINLVTIGGAAHGFPEGMRSVTAYINTWDVVLSPPAVSWTQTPVRV